MTSSSVINSGKFSGQKSNFSQTCAMLSQYLKDNGSFGDLSLGLSSNFQPQGCSRVAKTQDFLPMIEKSGGTMFPQQSEKSGEPKMGPQMTIFYEGEVIVFDEFPADKAQQIMALAGGNAASTSTNLVASRKVSSCTTSVVKQSNQMFPQTLINDADMPIVRKVSLARFFEKRKDRITARAPYQLSRSIATTTSSSKPIDNSKTWLSLAPLSPLQIHHRY